MKLRYLFLLLVAGATLSGYVLVFGDQGYLRQSYAERELAATRAAIRGLEKENQSLTDQYARLQERVPSLPAENADARPAGATGSATILKFEDDQNPDATGSPAGSSYFTPREQQPISLIEARALFLTGMFFLAILGYYGITRLERALRDAP
ncbi:MAG: hypothetical protein RIF32_03375 [Leptospirales bacterium]|jgi:hypothetical protein